MDVVIVGAGISGLATAHHIRRRARARNVEVNVRVLEAAARPGGTIASTQKDGFIVENAANGWLDSKPSTDALLNDLGITERRLVSDDAARKRFIMRRGRLHELPAGPGQFLTSGLISLGGKLRIFYEPWAKPPPDGVDESLAQFATRRLGREALEALIDPMASGIFAGNPETMSFAGCFPRLRDIEREHGGLVRGLRAIRKAGRKSAGPAPAGKLVSLWGGLQGLTDALADSLGDDLQLSCGVRGITRRTGEGFTVSTDDESIACDRVVVSAPAWAGGAMLESLDNGLAEEVGAIPYAAVSVVALAWKREDLPRDLDGFGFLIPSSEGRNILGNLWDSSIFPDRAPEGYVLTRSMVGGARRGDLAMAKPQEVIAMVREELRDILEIDAEPAWSHIVQHRRAIPQYVVGHGARLGRIDEHLKNYPGLYLSGNAYRGVGLNDCTAEAERVAEAIVGGT